MIEYYRGPYGINLLFRYQGSALAKCKRWKESAVCLHKYPSYYVKRWNPSYIESSRSHLLFFHTITAMCTIKAFVPGLLSVSIYLSLHYVSRFNDNPSNELVSHPYAVGVLVSSVSFLIIFRANYAYQRYWEACTNIHQVISKWSDATTFTAIFHMQCDYYDKMRPPSYYEYGMLNELRLNRNRDKSSREISRAWASDDHNNNNDCDDDDDHVNVSEQPPDEDTIIAKQNDAEHGGSKCVSSFTKSTTTLRRRCHTSINNETNELVDYTKNNILVGEPRFDGGYGLLYNENDCMLSDEFMYHDNNATKGPSSRDRRRNVENRQQQHQQQTQIDGFANRSDGHTPSLFLQELTHLSSLLVAVAMSTLRHDMDNVDPPLGTYIPGMELPVTDSTNLPHSVKCASEGGILGGIIRSFCYYLAMDATPKSRTRFNAIARPLLVIGGVSHAELIYIRRARGPYAKTQLVYSWLSDLIIREHLAGNMGNIAPPIITRVVQFLSDGMSAYNHALKITYIPFPFVHAQLSAFFVLMMVIIAIPFLMNQFADEVWLGVTLTFLTVTCLAGLHEVARELETPFRSVPNEIPLCTMLAYYNEALITSYAGFHPDAYWRTMAVSLIRDMKKKKDDGSPINSPVDR